jgi:hypothetical protein
MPVILLLGRLSSGGLRFLASSGKNVCKAPFQQKKLGVLVCACHPSYGEKHKIGGLKSRSTWAKSETLSKVTRAGGVTQGVECLPASMKS